MVTVRYVELSPVRVRHVNEPELWKFKRVASHVYGKEDSLSRSLLINEMIDSWNDSSFRWKAFNISCCFKNFRDDCTRVKFRVSVNVIYN